MVFLHQVNTFCSFYGPPAHTHPSLPLGAIAAAIIAIALPQPRKAVVRDQLLRRLQKLDISGACFLGSSTVCLLLSLQWGGSTYPWSDTRIIGLLIGSFLLFCIFVATQKWRGDLATIPPRLLRNRQIVAAWAFSFVFGGSYFTFSYYLPIYFQSIKGASATRSGIDSLALLLSCVLSSIVIGVGVTAVGYYTPFVIGGMAMYCVGCGLITTFAVDTPFARWFGFEILTGIGLGAGFALPSLAVQTVLSLDDVAVGSTICNFFFALGGTVFVSVGQTLFQNGLIVGVQRYLPNLDPNLILRVGATDLRNVLNQHQFGDDLSKALLAYMKGLRAVFILTLACSVASLVTACFWPWISVKKQAGSKENATQGGLQDDAGFLRHNDVSESESLR